MLRAVLCYDLIMVLCCVQKDTIWQDAFRELEACGHLCRNPQTPEQFIVSR